MVLMFTNVLHMFVGFALGFALGLFFGALAVAALARIAAGRDE